MSMSDASVFVQKTAVCLHLSEKIATETANLARGHGARSAVVHGLFKAASELKETLTCIQDTSAVLSTVEVLSGSSTLRWSDFTSALGSGDHFLDDLNYALREINKPTRILFTSRRQLRLKRSETRLSKYRDCLVQFHVRLQWPLSSILLWQPASPDSDGPVLMDAVGYLDRVRDVFHQESSSYGRFLDIMSQFKIGEIGTCRVISKVIGLFQTRRDLINGFNLFLPKDHHIETGDAASGPIQIISPRGVELYSEDGEFPKGADIESVNAYGDRDEEGPATSSAAINFVHKVQRHYKDEPAVYKAFLETLQVYQRDAIPILEVYERIAALFKSAPDLMEDFKSFLPNTAEMDIAGASQFRYSALDFANFETRFLSIKRPAPEAKGSHVSCDLAHGSLINAPNYLALSYCWGDDECFKSILLNGENIAITSNLEAALRRLQKEECITVWADALCINQQDNYERSNQVARMGSIYSLASKVIAWLGEEYDGSTQAMQALSALGDSPTNQAMYDRALQHKDAILRLLARPYWQRLWIIQEISKASNLEVWCGDEAVEWVYFIAGVNALAVGTAATRTLQHFCEQELASRRGDARMLLSMAMVRTSYANATDPRDKVYALLGLARDGSEVVPVPNYVQDSLKVFEDVSRRMIVTQGQISLILLAGRRPSRGGLPSWLPTWETQKNINYPHWLRNAVLRSTSKPSQFLINKNTLTISAFKMHEIKDSERSDSNKTVLPLYIDVNKMSTLPPHQRMGPPNESLELDLDADDPAAAVLRLTLPTLLDPGDLGFEPENKRLESEAIHRLYDLVDLLRLCGDADIKADRYWHCVVPDLLCFWSSDLSLPRLSRLRHLKSQCKYLLGFNIVLYTDDETRLRIDEEQSPERYLQNSVLAKLEDALEMMELHSMKFVREDGHRPYIVPLEALHGDCVYKFENCALPVLLRPTGDGTYSVVGGVVIDDKLKDGDSGWFSRLDGDEKQQQWQDVMLV